MNFFNINFQMDKEFILRLLFSLAAVSVIMLAWNESAFATAASGGDANDVVGQTLCRLVQNLSGGVARGIATIAIFAVGVGLFLGKLNWGIAAATAAGVGIIFAAPKLVAFLSGDANNSACPTS